MDALQSIGPVMPPYTAAAPDAPKPEPPVAPVESSDQSELDTSTQDHGMNLTTQAILLLLKRSTREFADVLEMTDDVAVAGSIAGVHSGLVERESVDTYG